LRGGRIRVWGGTQNLFDSLGGHLFLNWEVWGGQGVDGYVEEGGKERCFGAGTVATLRWTMEKQAELKGVDLTWGGPLLTESEYYRRRNW